jgi:hypothetical protein
MEPHEKLHDLRQKVLANKEVSSEEYKEVIDSLRGGRVSAGEKKKASSRSTVVEIDPDDIFGS